MLKVLAFYSELKKCIRKYALRIGPRERKCKVEEREEEKNLCCAGEREMEREGGRARLYLKRIRII